MRRAGLVAIIAVVVLPACGTSASTDVTCQGGGDTLVLSAQAVPQATMLPCVVGFPTGWSNGGYVAKTGSVRFWMDSDRAGQHAIEVELSTGCDTRGASALASDPSMIGVVRSERPGSVDPPSGRRFYTFDGGCVTLRYDFLDGAEPGLLAEAERSLELVPRSLLVSTLAENRGVVLCGAGAPACG